MKKSLLVFTILFLFWCQGMAQVQVTHLVLFKLKTGIDKKDVRFEKAKAALRELPKKIPFIADWSAGENFSIRSIAYDFGLHVVFDSKKDLQNYLVHPAHVESANLWKEIADWNIVDFEDGSE